MGSVKLVSRTLEGNILHLEYEAVDIRGKKFSIKFSINLDSNFNLSDNSRDSHKSPYGYGYGIYSEKPRELLFGIEGDVIIKEIVETKKMTLEEIEKKLGCKIELVSH